jgi:nuclear transport factor 2 (NTF2) superfamily protein
MTSLFPVSKQHEQLLRDTYDAFNTRDIERALTLMHEHVDWPNAFEGGRVRGRERVREYWKRQFESIDPRVLPQRIELTSDGRVAVTVHQLVRDLEGNTLSDGAVEHRYVIEDGLIERMDVQEPER